MDDSSRSARRSTAQAGADARLLAFLAPGIAHALGNQLFALRGAVSVLGHEHGSGRANEIAADALGEAEQVLGVLRLFAEPAGEVPVEQAGVLLSRLGRLCRVPLRDRALDLEISHSSLRRPRGVAPGRFVRAVGELLRCTVEGLPSFVSGTLLLDLAEQVPAEVVVALRVAPREPILPFPLELPSIARAAEPFVVGQGGRLEPRGDDRLLLHVPVA
jgi:hypothetical protein